MQRKESLELKNTAAGSVQEGFFLFLTLFKTIFKSNIDLKKN